VLERLVTDHSDALVREAAVASLGAIGHPGPSPSILAATTDIATVRRRAVIALAPFDGPEVDDALERARTDRDWQVRQAAEDLLAAPPVDREPTRSAAGCTHEHRLEAS
jgi:HEAT repeat protein